jgi:hypothetical protein
MLASFYTSGPHTTPDCEYQRPAGSSGQEAVSACLGLGGCMYSQCFEAVEIRSGYPDCAALHNYCTFGVGSRLPIGVDLRFA